MHLLIAAALLPCWLAAGLGLFVVMAPPVQPDRPWDPDQPLLSAWSALQVQPSPAPHPCCAVEPMWGVAQPNGYEP